MIFSEYCWTSVYGFVQTFCEIKQLMHTCAPISPLWCFTISVNALDFLPPPPPPPPPSHSPTSYPTQKSLSLHDCTSGSCSSLCACATESAEFKKDKHGVVMKRLSQAWKQKKSSSRADIVSSSVLKENNSRNDGKSFMLSTIIGS